MVLNFLNLVFKKYGKWFLKMCRNSVKSYLKFDHHTWKLSIILKKNSWKIIVSDDNAVAYFQMSNICFCAVLFYSGLIHDFLLVLTVYCCNLLISMALNVWFTKNGMCTKNNTHVYMV